MTSVWMCLFALWQQYRWIVTSCNTLVTYTDKSSEPMLTRIFGFQTLILGCSISDLQVSNSEPLDKLCSVPSLVTHPDNPWFQSCHAPLSKLWPTPSPVTCSCHMNLSHTIVTHPWPSTPALVLGTSNNTRHPWASVPTLVFWASTNTQWTSSHPPHLW